ncbi:MAG: glycosyltransferase family 4 protein, partial [Rhodospirillales bacterium]|nr:glycosyltransferase family 4 protein [Rhodospirillales bacterium]
RIGARHVTMPLASKNPMVIRANIERLVYVIRHFGVDIVHARSRAPAWSALYAAQRAGCHFVTTFHGTYSIGLFGLKQKYNSVMVRGERVIAISQFIADHIQSHYQVDPTLVRIIHRGVDLSKFDPARVSPERIIQLARQWRLPDGAPVIMLPARLTRWKGQAVLIEALAQLGRKDLRCLLVGSEEGKGNYKAELENMVRRKGLTDVVHIVGDCNDMPAAYMLTDVVVSASTQPEAFGRVITEAQAMGRPVVASGHGGARETVLHGETGFLTKPGDASSLAAALNALLTMDGRDRQRVAANGRTYVRRNFTTAQMCVKTLDVYSEVLAGSQSVEGEAL